ncbi:MAG: Lon protease family protein [Hyphomicrobiales bacterium]|nr:Lon protease family protein [Hyphomicrobiales bacterium]
MFFRRAAQDKPPAKPAEAAFAATGSAAPVTALAVSELRRTVDAASLGFKSTADLTPNTGLIGQDRALAAIEFGTDMAAYDYNIFVLGPPASGKRTAVRTQLEARAKLAPAPDDWVYVYNFATPNRPRALKLPHGRARAFAAGMVAAVDELRSVVPALFEGEDYQARRRSIDGAFQSTQERAFEALSEKARGMNIAIMRTPQGFAFAPTHEGKVIKPETFNMLPEAMQKEKQRQIGQLEEELSAILSQVPKTDKERRAKITELNETVAKSAVIGALDDQVAAFRDVPAAVEYLETAAQDMVRNIAMFLPAGEGEQQQLVREPADSTRDPRYRRYMVNVMVANGENGATGAPIVEENNPVYGNLVGRVEHIAQMGALVTDFLLMKPGALHRANGGVLMVDARKLLLSPFAYEALKRALKAREIRIEQPSETSGLIATQSLDPEPIPLSVKVVLIGEREIYYLLSQKDPDFPGLFKVQADFDDTIARTEANYRSYAEVIASIVKDHKLAPVDADAVAAVIEQGSRIADDREKLSIQIGRISDLVREADYWARKGGRTTVTRADVARAVEAAQQRADRIRDRAQETFDRGLVLVDVAGSRVGTINGLAVLQVGDFAFGRPNRITARVRLGSGRVTDIEREAKLGGPLHSKGIMILWGFLAGRYAQDIPLALAATIVFEQSYGGVDGDSASSTELYALVSALADAPIRQGLAVTGSVNQWGDVQAIGGVNEKIEGFFDICNARGLTGEQGVLVPKSNVQHLMLREDVVEACRQGRFNVYPIETIDQGIELLTGLPAGAPLAGGGYPDGSINARVEARLRTYAEHARSFGRSGPANGAAQS